MPPSPDLTEPRPSPDDGVAVVFPGQGSQSPGAGAAWVDHPAWTVVEQAEAAVDRPLRHLLLDADADLSRTEDSQLSVLLASLLAWEAVRPRLAPPVAFAGHSLGQITALIAAGAVDLAEGVRLARVRAEVTQHAADESPGGLVALLGATPEQARAAVDGVEGAWVANDNAPGQLVIGGTPEGLEAAGAAARAAGVRKVRALGVGGAFHTPLMDPAAAAFAPAVDATAFSATTTPIVTNHDARPHHGPGGWGERLTTHLVRPVRWRESVDALVEVGARRIVEVGPGTTLTALVRRCRDDVETASAATPDQVDALVGPLDGARRA